MMEHIAISVIVPIYNTKPYLEELKPKFMAHKKHLDAILPDILHSKYLPLGEKLRAAAFCASPALTYGAAAAWGRFHERKGK